MHEILFFQTIWIFTAELDNNISRAYKKKKIKACFLSFLIFLK